jgi:AraC family transcriptional regulator
MEPRIVCREAFSVVGMQIITTLRSTAVNMDLARLWMKFAPRIDEIGGRVDPAITYCIRGNPADTENSQCEMTDETQQSELVCAEVAYLADIPSGMTGLVVPARTYAVFTHKGSVFPIHLRQTYGHIYGGWLPGSGYETDGGFDFELYDERRFKAPDDPSSEVDIYIPVRAPAA